MRLAYKIGFSSALNEDTISAYLEMAKWEFEGDKIKVRKLKRAFGHGYETAFRILLHVRYELKTAS